MADDDARREFKARAPELRAALVAELSAAVDRASGLSADEAEVLRHLLAHAGFSEEGSIYLPSFAILWGEEPSYVPAVRLPADRVRVAVSTLRRRGVFAGSQAAAGGVILVAAVVRALAAAPELQAASPAPKARKPRKPRKR